jgi:glycosyltransferase involved in cell wall biosynthesis
VRVVHYLWSAEIGGIERLVLDLIGAQRERGGSAPTVLFGSARGALLDLYRQSGAPIESANLRGGADISPTRLRRIRPLLASCDVVHMHAFHPLVAYAAARSGARVVFTEHGAFGLGRRRTIADRVKRVLKGRFLNRNVDCVTFNSEHTKRTARALFGLEDVPQHVVYNGTRVRNLLPLPTAESGIEERCRGRFVIGAVARFTRRKRIDRLVEGCSRMREREGALLLLVGDGPERPHLEELTRARGLSDASFFTGYQVDVARYQRLMDVCVIPSENEPFGLVTVEALVLGKPALVFRDGGGMVEVVAGLEPRDVVSDVEELARRLEEHREMIRAGRDGSAERRAYARRFDIGVMADRMQEIYRGLLDGHR